MSMKATAASTTHFVDEGTNPATGTPRTIMLTPTFTALGHVWVARLIEDRGAAVGKLGRVDRGILGRTCGERRYDDALRRAKADLEKMDRIDSHRV